MTEPLIVDPDQLNAASAILEEAAGDIPVEVPKFSVSGKDPLSLAIADGAVHVEAPMAALPGIKANATATAQNIASAAQKYSSTDEMLAEKVKQHQFAPAGGGPNPGGQPKPPQLTKADPNVVPLEEIERQRNELQDKILKVPDAVAGIASDQIGKAVMKGPGEVAEGVQKWFKDPGKLGFESGFTRSNVVTASIMAVPSAIRDIADGESVGKVVTSKASGVGAGILAGALTDMAAGALIGGPAGAAVGLVVGLGFAAFASDGAESAAGWAWDAAAGLLP